MTKLIKAKALDRVEAPAAILITELGRKLRAEGRSIVSLSIGEPDLGTPVGHCQCWWQAGTEQCAVRNT